MRSVSHAQLAQAGPLPPLSKLRLFVEVATTYLTVRRLMSALPIEAVTRELRPVVAPAALDAETCLRVGRRLASPVRRTLDPGPWDSRCLMRSLVLLSMLARRGIPSSLVIGVRPGESLEAHAWVEWSGRPLLPTLGFEPLTVI